MSLSGAAGGSTSGGAAGSGNGALGAGAGGTANAASRQSGAEQIIPAHIVPAPAAVSLTSLPSTTSVRLERDALMAMLQYPRSVGRDLLVRASGVGYSNAALAAVRDAIALSIDAFDQPDWVGVIAEAVAPHYRGLVEQMAVAPIPERPGRELDVYVRKVTSSLIERHLVRRKEEVKGQLQRTDADTHRQGLVFTQNTQQQSFASDLWGA